MDEKIIQISANEFGVYTLTNVGRVVFINNAGEEHHLVTDSAFMKKEIYRVYSRGENKH